MSIVPTVDWPYYRSAYFIITTTIVAAAIIRYVLREMRNRP